MKQKSKAYFLPCKNGWPPREQFSGERLLGFFLGILPGGGAVLSSFTAYAIEKRFSKYPEKFGTGVIEGVAAPESANNAAAQASFIPLLSLGIPTNVVIGLCYLEGLLIHGVQPGPLLIQNHPEIFWGVVTSMYIGNIMLLALNLPLIGIWVKVLKAPVLFAIPFDSSPLSHWGLQCK